MAKADPGLPFKAVLWDIDGTLADSEPVHQASFEAVCDRLRVGLPPGFHEALIGKSDAETHAWLVARCGLDVPFDSWLAARFEAYFQRLDQVTAHRSAIELWHGLDRLGVAQATVSNSDRVVVNANLRRLGLERPGLVSVSRNDVINGKPDPEPYLRGAHLLGVPPGEVAVIEDSATGLLAGQRAGMQVFMMPWFERTDLGEWMPFAALANRLAELQPVG